MQRSSENLLSRIEELENRLGEAEQLIEAIKAGEVDAFALNKNNRSEVFTLQSGDYAYRVLVENFNEGALNLSEDGLIVYTNTSFHETLKLTYEKVIGKNIFEFIHPESRATFNELFKKGLAGQSKGEINLITGNSIIPVYVSLTSLYPTLPTVGMIVTDLRERKAYEQMMLQNKELEIAKKSTEESEKRFRSLAQTLPQLVWVTDAEGKSEFASFRWKEYSGIEPDGEKEWRALVHPDDYDDISTAWAHSLSTGDTYKSDVRLKNKEGEYRWHTVLGKPVLEQKRIVKWVGAFIDVHEQKIKDDKKDEFISIASHELKTPLTTAKAYLQMLEFSIDENNEDASLYAKKASHAVERINELISELLDVSKIRLGKLDYTITTFNFNDMVNNTIENIQLTSLTHKIIRSGKVTDEVTGDKRRLQQVIINLLSNAIKYSPNANEVFVNTEQKEGIIKVTVKDTGIGMSMQNLDKIFDRYHRIEEHAIHFQGLGIGLFISYEIIQRHNGKLWAESELGKGSTFYFTIPVK